MFSVRKLEPTSIPSADLYIFSSPKQIDCLAGKMKKILKKLEISQEGAKYALVTTCMNHPNTKSLKIMEKLLQSKDLLKVSDDLMIKLTGIKGPLESGYEEKLDTFAEDILKAIN